MLALLDYLFVCLYTLLAPKVKKGVDGGAIDACVLLNTALCLNFVTLLLILVYLFKIDGTNIPNLLYATPAFIGLYIYTVARYAWKNDYKKLLVAKGIVDGKGSSKIRMKGLAYMVGSFLSFILIGLLLKKW